MKDVLLNRSGPFWLAARKFLYFAGACVIAAIFAERGVSDAYQGSIMPHPSAVALSACFRMGWYLFLFLLPWEAYKSILAASMAIEEMRSEKERADKFAHGFKFQQVAETAPAPASTPFIVDRGEDPTIDMERLPTPWQTDPQWKKKEAERPTIGFVQGVKSRANSAQTESVQAWCKRNGIKY